MGGGGQSQEIPEKVEKPWNGQTVNDNRGKLNGILGVLKGLSRLIKTI
jgi:hypothetical protein